VILLKFIIKDLGVCSALALEENISSFDCTKGKLAKTTYVSLNVKFSITAITQVNPLQIGKQIIFKGKRTLR